MRATGTPGKPKPAAPLAAKKRGKKDEVVEAAPVEALTIVPADQLQLTPKQLDEDVTRVITASNPQVPHGLVMFSFPDHEFRAVPGTVDEHIVQHVRKHATTLHPESEEALEQKAAEKAFKAMVDDRRRQRLIAAQESGKELSPTELEEDDTQRNQFNFTERAAQTQTPSTKFRVVSTTPPETATTHGFMSQWSLYDAYVAELERLAYMLTMDKPVGGAAAGKKLLVVDPDADGFSGGPKVKVVPASHPDDPMHTPLMALSLRTVERIVNQNAEDEVYSDFKFWEDASDSHRTDGLGTCLPLWRFEDARTKRKMVTALAWNPNFPDLFAVGYGSYDFMKQGSGLICVYTLKNVGHPEYTFSTDSGVVSLDFHPQHSALLAVGLYDGSVAVYDVRKRENKAIFMSDARSGKHADPVWEVRWALEPGSGDAAGGGGASGALGGAGGGAAIAPSGASSSVLLTEPLFYSISSDGHVCSWTVTKSELRREDILLIKVLPPPPTVIPGGAVVVNALAAAAAAGGGGKGKTLGGAGAVSASVEGLGVGGEGGAHAGAAGDEVPAPPAAPAGSAVAAVAALQAAAAAAAAAAGEGALPVPGDAGGVVGVTGLAGGCCIAFSPFFPSTYIVGTEEGRIHKASLETADTITSSFGGGHHMAVYALRWNPWHPRVFLSASADWTVKMWDDSYPASPIMSFDLGNSVGDVAWAPYSSTVFCAVTDESKVHVWDLDAKKKEPLCEQKIVKKARCTHVAFNAAAPIIIVGDSAGGVTSLKLSPNLRRVTPIPVSSVKKGDAAIAPPRREEIEVRKLDRILFASDARINIVTPIPGAERPKEAVIEATTDP